MRSFVLGTAGHIDHGKSALVRALTGTDPDRLKEERERGITIDLGFAHLPLGEAVISFVDVPGHERFVRNMLAGAHGIDGVLLVVAADESVMPQTREHFHICRLLGIPRGVVALTKCDLADAELQALAELETRELLAGSFLEGAQVVRVSAKTGAGLPELRAALGELAAAPGRSTAGLLRLPVDRVFSKRGFGTVVTGTLVSGQLAVGEELELLPASLPTRVRGIQVHGGPVEAVEATSRVAVNCAGLEVPQVGRGDVLARPASLLATSMVDVEVSLIEGVRPLKDQARVRVHLASAEVMARVRLLSAAPALEAGTAGLAQLRLERPAVAGYGDRLILRSYSPATTIGGARVLDPLPPRRRRRDRARLAEVEALRGASPLLAARSMVLSAGLAGIPVATLSARVTRPRDQVLAELGADPGYVLVGGEAGAFLSRAAVEDLARQTTAALERFHAKQPLRPAMPREELRGRLFARCPPGAFERVLDDLSGAGQIRVVQDGLALRGHVVELTSEEQAARTALIEVATRAGLEGLDRAGAAAAARLEPGLAQRVLRVLLAERVLTRVGESLLVHRPALETLAAEVRGRWPAGSRVDVAAFKELTGLTRKYLIPLLEYLDREKVTRRSGNERVVLG